MAREEIIYNMETARAERVMLEGRQHIKVPAVMLVEGVVKGSSGPLYYPREEMSKKVKAWDHRPVVVYHPVKKGVPVSAADVKVLNTQKVGLILNTRYTVNGKAKLKTDVYLDEERSKKIIPDIVRKIDAGEPVEVSTGLFTTNEEKKGRAGGKEYTAIAREFVPDHLAILPSGKGACSVSDGAGLNMNSDPTVNKDSAPVCVTCNGKMTCNSCSKKGVTANAMSNTRVHGKLQGALDEKYGQYQTHVRDVYPGFVVYGRMPSGSGGYSSRDVKLHKHEYKVDKRKGESDQISLKGEPEEIEQVTEYRTKDGTFVGNASAEVHNPGGDDVDKEKMVGSIIANSGGQLDESDREWLMKRAPEWLKTLPGGTVAATPPAVPTPTTNASQQQPVNVQVQVVPPEPPKQQTLQELIANADPATRELLQEGLAARESERNGLITAITANSACKFSKDELATFQLPVLRKMAGSMGVKEGITVPSNYFGAGGPVPAGMLPPNFVANSVPGVPANPPVLSPPLSTRPQKA